MSDGPRISDSGRAERGPSGPTRRAESGNGMSYAALYGSELRRLVARRAVRVALAVALGVTVLVVVVATLRSTGTGPFDHTMRLRTLWLEDRGGTRETTVLAMSVYVFVLLVGLGATAIGGDYRAGTVGTPLTWEPRRVRLASARLLAVSTVAVGIYLLVTGVLVGGWYLGAATRGSTAGVSAHFWSDLAGVVARCTLTAVVLSVVTAGIVLITRSTVGGILAWFGYAIAIEGVLGSRITGLREKLLFVNLSAFLGGHPIRFNEVGTGLHRAVVEPSGGLVILALVTVVVGTLGILAFRRRDVT